MNANAHFTARILLGLIFLVAGFGKVMGGAAIAGFIESKIPGLGFMAWPVSIFELVAGIFILIGYQTRITALLLAGFCIFTGVIYHGFGDQMQMTATLKNLAMAGGYLMLFVHGAGKWSVDRS